MLLPHMTLRKFKLRRALRHYPVYDPPHKAEERLLSKAKATENFDYFMRVRLQRSAYFQDWLRRYFGVTLTPDEAGVRALNRWGNKYAGLLLLPGPSDHQTPYYFTYDPPWTGENAGCNVVFDIGITMGEFIIANCPKLRWDVDPISAILPRRAGNLKDAEGTSFQRPMLASSENPVWGDAPLHYTYIFSTQMSNLTTTFDSVGRYYALPARVRNGIKDQLINRFKSILDHYLDFDYQGLLGKVSREKYLRLTATQAELEDDDDE